MMFLCVQRRLHPLPSIHNVPKILLLSLYNMYRLVFRCKLVACMFIIRSMFYQNVSLMSRIAARVQLLQTGIVMFEVDGFQWNSK